MKRRGTMSDEKKEVKVDDGLAAKVRKLEEKLNRLGKRLEELLGFDLDGDGKVGKFGRAGMRVLAGVAAFMLAFVTISFATTIWNLRDTANTYDVVNINHTGLVTCAGGMITSNAVTLSDGTSQIRSGVASGTTKASIELYPNATAVTNNPLRLVRVGDVGTGDYFGFTSKSNRTVGFTVNVGRPAASWATNTFDTTGDYAMHVMANNNATNDTAYVMKGAYFKTKNSSVGTLGNMVVMELENLNSGTASSNTILKLRDTGTMSHYKIDMYDAVTSKIADVRFPMGATMKNRDANTLEIEEATVKVNGSLWATNSSSASKFYFYTNGVAGPYMLVNASNDLVLVSGASYTVTNTVVGEIND
jgi:hypothetical protein